MKITALAGGVGGAKLLEGLKELLEPDELTAIVNTGDDFWHLGLFICPDFDTILYTLSGVANPVTGWGIRDDTFITLEKINKMGGPSWFKLGDQDLATHILRTHLKKNGKNLTEISRILSAYFNVSHAILPMTNFEVPTFVRTKQYGEIPFQEYFVKYRFEPVIEGFIFRNIDNAKPSEEVMKSLRDSDAVIICPSNPFVSIDPIIHLEGIRSILLEKFVVCVSPIIGGLAIKGPLAKMFHEMNIKPSPSSIARYYEDFLDMIFIDYQDNEEITKIKRSSIIPIESDIFLPDKESRIRLAKEILKQIGRKF